MRQIRPIQPVRMMNRWIALLLLANFGHFARCLPAETQSINLATALRLAGAQNLTLAIARERVTEARTLHEKEKQLLYPWIAPGFGYHRHDGNVQDVAGNIFDASKQSAAAALTVQSQLDLGDSIYRALAAKQTVRATEADEAVRHREILAATAGGYLDLSRAVAAVGVAEDSVRIADGLLLQVQQAVEAGIAFAGDAQRASVQRERNEILRLKASEQVRISSVRLAQILHLPATVKLQPDLAEFIPITLIISGSILRINSLLDLQTKSEAIDEL